MKLTKFKGFVNDLQMSYRVEREGIVVGYIRKVNHGKRPWLFYPNTLNGLRTSHTTLAGLKIYLEDLK